jgi:hypothetical protein
MEGHLKAYSDKYLAYEMSGAGIKNVTKDFCERLSVQDGSADPYSIKDTFIFSEYLINEMYVARLGKADVTLKDYSIGFGINNDSGSHRFFYVKVGKLLS